MGPTQVHSSNPFFAVGHTCLPLPLTRASGCGAFDHSPTPLPFPSAFPLF
ncbi:transcriptional regulator ATRX (X-linked helicase II) [Corchorus olitorius]|uniref:Transcriptional regulator ATRX (X-linked helicase II) n=1 Tax=Corchorus olitorius TaxID=93759 RepID=A0A1R3JZV9_9ROSI|nr:transcriptional regulator ATRX (X-linked helicase II) [Corchorus olitorius]